MSWQDIENILLTSLTNAAAKRIESNKAPKTKPKVANASMSGIDVGAIMRSMGMPRGKGNAEVQSAEPALTEYDPSQPGAQDEESYWDDARYEFLTPQNREKAKQAARAYWDNQL